MLGGKKEKLCAARLGWTWQIQQRGGHENGSAREGRWCWNDKDEAEKDRIEKVTEGEGGVTDQATEYRVECGDAWNKGI